MKKLTLLWLTILLGGCTVARPVNINGKYYMLGDTSCVKYKELSDSRIMCGNKANEETGYRDAMTDYDLQMYQRITQQQSQITTTNCYKTFGGGMSCTSF